MMARRWYSRRYYNSPMPHSIFFYHGFAIHGTTELARLGGPASHGCVRLHPSHAAALFAWVERSGPRNTLIEISNWSVFERSGSRSREEHASKQETGGAFLNRPITLSSIDENSCDAAEIRAVIVQS
ncbi:L,D-transpeptidase [Bradyrhizobium sediminis]|uniref:L,D-transpeptidase n=1 Tax=Bradyrhizobium sediminis TaxID=2840469 RepID=A0A975NED2_9BRAD|nr:L,D-transpeptidase [Bradyrhizobium sediminis]QWG12939.1 L,D-transpeptidase [Bradyrhizobium sediminis]